MLALFLHIMAWCSVEKQARKDSGSVEQVNYYEHFREHNHVERSLGHKDKQRMSATSQVKKRRRTSTSHQCKCCGKVFSRPLITAPHADPHWRKTAWMLWVPQDVFNIEQSTASHANPHWRETTRMLSQEVIILQRHMLGEKPHECSECTNLLMCLFRSFRENWKHYLWHGSEIHSRKFFLLCIHVVFSVWVWCKNVLWHSGHLCGFSPVWISMWQCRA